MTTIRVDIWGGEASCEHIARFHLSMEEAMTLSSRELRDGYLINLRALADGEGWGPSEDYDSRSTLISGHA